MTTSELLKKIEPQLKYLSNTRICGMEKEDIQQELTLTLLEDVRKNPDFLKESYKEGWWFKRLKWYLLNLKEKESREPVNRSIRFDSFDGKGRGNAKK